MTTAPAKPYGFDGLSKGPDNTDSLFICLAFSGGGTRAAALSYGVLKALRDTNIVWQGKRKRLLDEVDCITSVSGGSFTAAYYGLFKDRIFADFRRAFLDRDVQSELEWALVSPANWVRLASSTYSRIDMAARMYGAEIFGHKTFGELFDSGRPYLMINATDLASGGQFTFSQSQFDLLGSTITDYPIARAVAASSAFPLLLSPITLQNHPQPKGYTRPPWIDVASRSDARNRERHREADNALRQLAMTDGHKTRRYIHILDGGLADNTGVEALLNAYRYGFIRRLLKRDRIKHFVVVVVNALSEQADTISSKESPPGLEEVAYKVGTTSMDDLSFAIVERLKSELQQHNKALIERHTCNRHFASQCPTATPLGDLASHATAHVLDVSFSRVTDPAKKAYFFGLPTSFSLPKSAVDRLIALGPELLAGHGGFRHLKRALGPTPPLAQQTP